MNRVVTCRRLNAVNRPISAFRGDNGNRQVDMIAPEASKSIVILQYGQIFVTPLKWNSTSYLSLRLIDVFWVLKDNVVMWSETE